MQCTDIAAPAVSASPRVTDDRRPTNIESPVRGSSRPIEPAGPATLATSRRPTVLPASQVSLAYPRRFVLIRLRDVTGVSGTGRVADGVQWPDGAAVLRWHGRTPSTSLWESVEAIEAVHGHEGATRTAWLDDEQARTTPPVPGLGTPAVAGAPRTRRSR